ncbi:hypothetical protein [Erwinia psidii]|uniref:hypothetical protein n=1 Tax=Erwinia psidii TaxID=69224 RepID=UPI00397C082C
MDARHCDSCLTIELEQQSRKRSATYWQQHRGRDSCQPICPRGRYSQLTDEDNSAHKPYCTHLR